MPGGAERLGNGCDGAARAYRAEGDPYGAAWALAEQGWYAMIHGRLEESEQCLGEALDLRRRHGDDRRLVGDQFNVGEALADLSAQAALDARWPDAARLAGASEALHEPIGALPWESVTAMQERALVGAREALGSRYAAASRRAVGCPPRTRSRAC
jgi:hypothetical protein